MLVKLVSGASVNPDTLKHIYIEQKTISGKKTWIVQLKLDDNTIHPIAYYATKKEAMDCVKQCVENINSHED